MNRSEAGGDAESASELITRRIAELDDWRGETLGRIRALIKEADPDILEEWKWRGTPVWSHDGIVCTGETYKKVVKMTFAKGASLEDPAGLFNSSLEGNVRRAIDVHEGEEIDEPALKALIRAAVELNTAGKKASRRASEPARRRDRQRAQRRLTVSQTAATCRACPRLSPRAGRALRACAGAANGAGIRTTRLGSAPLFAPRQHDQADPQTVRSLRGAGTSR